MSTTISVSIPNISKMVQSFSLALSMKEQIKFISIPNISKTVSISSQMYIISIIMQLLVVTEISLFSLALTLASVLVKEQIKS